MEEHPFSGPVCRPDCDDCAREAAERLCTEAALREESRFWITQWVLLICFALDGTTLVLHLLSQ